MATLTFPADPRRTAPALQTRPDAIDKPIEVPCKARVLKPAQVESWQSSSFDLLSPAGAGPLRDDARPALRRIVQGQAAAARVDRAALSATLPGGLALLLER